MHQLVKETFDSLLFVLCLCVLLFLFLTIWLLTPHNIKHQLNNYNYNYYYWFCSLYYNRYRSLVPRNIKFFTPCVLYIWLTEMNQKISYPRFRNCLINKYLAISLSLLYNSVLSMQVYLGFYFRTWFEDVESTGC